MGYTFSLKTFLRKTFVPLILITCCPAVVMLIWHINVHHLGSFTSFFESVNKKGIWQILDTIWFNNFFGTLLAWKIIGIFSIFQIAFMILLPGKTYYGPETINGYIPKYKNNGLLAYILSLILFVFTSKILKLFSPGILYYHFGEILATLNFFALIFCLFLYLKGLIYPSGKDKGKTGSIIFDYYWGTELYPRIFNIDIKMFTNNRFGMISWALLVLSYVFAKHEIYGEVDLSICISASLIIIYLFKFFLWEKGYMYSMDIIVDRAGFYICWGCLVWVPSLYTSPVLFMVNTFTDLNIYWAIIIFLLGFGFIFTNYWADLQKQITRKTKGQASIFGKQPLIIKAIYTNNKKQLKENLLLASGFWGWSRHFHYIPEILSAFIWSATSGFISLMPFIYVIFLCILLFHRVYRNELQCKAKYGTYWNEYCKLVPYKIIPKIF